MALLLGTRGRYGGDLQGDRCGVKRAAGTEIRPKFLRKLSKKIAAKVDE